MRPLHDAIHHTGSFFQPQFTAGPQHRGPSWDSIPCIERSRKVLQCLEEIGFILGEGIPYRQFQRADENRGWLHGKEQGPDVHTRRAIDVQIVEWHHANRCSTGGYDTATLQGQQRQPVRFTILQDDNDGAGITWLRDTDEEAYRLPTPLPEGPGSRHLI